MPVYTEKEYISKISKNSVDSFDKKVNTSGGRKKVTSPSHSFLYYLLHPENGVNEKQNFQDEIILDGISYKRICENGVIKTKEDELYHFLIKKGYLLMKKERVQ